MEGVTDQPRWRKSSYSGDNGGGCVEISDQPGQVMIRDSKLGHESPILAVTWDDFRTFVASVQ